MSAPITSGNLALARPAPGQPARGEAPRRRHLELATPRPRLRTRPRLAHAIVVVGGIAAILLVQLLLSFALADGAYYISSLQAQQRDLQRQEEALSERLEVLGSTQNLIANAEALGMVASGNPMFLDLESGHVSGSHSKDGKLPKNLIPNALLDGSTVLDAEALAAIEAAGRSAGETRESALNGVAPASAVTGSTAPGTLPSPITR